mmetsp:Transcript_18987/g.44962  ORF Transcript_18987/g.44962 Transcript_18987/m.44962 type:complete len:241 (+) Transcript_18987:356-1078(+)
MRQHSEPFGRATPRRPPSNTELHLHHLCTGNRRSWANDLDMPVRPLQELRTLESSLTDHSWPTKSPRTFAKCSYRSNIRPRKYRHLCRQCTRSRLRTRRILAVPLPFGMQTNSSAWPPDLGRCTGICLLDSRPIATDAICICVDWQLAHHPNLVPGHEQTQSTAVVWLCRQSRNHRRQFATVRSSFASTSCRSSGRKRRRHPLVLVGRSRRCAWNRGICAASPCTGLCPSAASAHFPDCF